MKTTSSITRDIGHESPMRQKVSINGSDLFLDVPEMFGGTGSAPTPHDYVDAALLACKAITIRMIAGQKQIPLNDVNITLNSDASKEKEGLYVMNLDIELIGDLTDEQRQMLMTAAEQFCPVGKILTGKVKVEINERLV